jgi:hypothetical protein
MRTHVFLPLVMAVLTVLVAAGALAWPRTPAYGRTQSVTALAGQVQVDPGAWLGRRVSVRGRLISLFKGNMAAQTGCVPAVDGPVQALAGADGVPVLLLGLARPQSSWLDGVLSAIPSVRGALNHPPRWPSTGGWQELEGRLVTAPDCVAAGPHALYLEVERVRAAASS